MNCRTGAGFELDSLLICRIIDIRFGAGLIVISLIMTLPNDYPFSLDHHETYYASAYTTYDFHEEDDKLTPFFDYDIRREELVWGYQSKGSMSKIRIDGRFSGPDCHAAGPKAHKESGAPLPPLMLLWCIVLCVFYL